MAEVQLVQHRKVPINSVPSLEFHFHVFVSVWGHEQMKCSHEFF